MSIETRKVLEMLAAGKITEEDAEQLLDKLAAAKQVPDGSAPETQGSPGATAMRKHLRIVVSGAGEDVNMRVPLSFVRAGAGLIGVLPARVAQKLSDRGVNLENLSHLQGDKLNEALNELSIDVDANDGKHVRIFCE